MILDRLMKVIILVIIYTLSIYDIRKNLKTHKPVKVEFKFSENVVAGIYRYALVLTNKLISISSDGQRMFDLVEVQGFHNIFILF